MFYRGYCITYYIYTFIKLVTQYGLIAMKTDAIKRSIWINVLNTKNSVLNSLLKTDFSIDSS